MDEDIVVQLGWNLIYRHRRCNQRIRTLWQSHIDADRLEKGEFHTLMGQLRKDDGPEFFNYFRMSQNTFDELLDILKPHIQKKVTHLRIPISAEQRLAISLR